MRQTVQLRRVNRVNSNNRLSELPRFTTNGTTTVRGPTIHSTGLTNFELIRHGSCFTTSYNGKYNLDRFTSFNILHIVNSSTPNNTRCLKFVDHMILTPTVPIGVVINSVNSNYAIGFRKVNRVRLRKTRLRTRRVVLKINNTTKRTRTRISENGITNNKYVRAAHNGRLQNRFNNKNLTINSDSTSPEHELTNPHVVHTRAPHGFRLTRRKGAAALHFRGRQDAQVRRQQNRRVVSLVPVRLIRKVRVDVTFSFICAGSVNTTLPRRLNRQDTKRSRSNGRRYLVHCLRSSSRV